MLAAKKLFFGRTIDDTLFDEDIDEKQKKFLDSDCLTTREKEEIRVHRPVVLRLYKYILLYISTLFECLMTRNTISKLNCLCFTNRNKKLIRLLAKTETRLEEELDVIKLIQDLRKLQVLVLNSPITAKTKFMVAHSSANVVNLESSEASQEDD